jgi:versiconal hemiacetal acetate reductase
MTKIYYALDPVGQSPISAMGISNTAKTVNQVGLSRKHILDAVTASCARLGTYIDLLQIHRLDRGTPSTEIMRALHDVVRGGQVRYLGASSMATWEFQKLQSVAERNGWTKFICMQNYYNLLYREEEREMIPYCADAGIGILPWSPLARGVLAHSWDQRASEREKTDKLLQTLVRNKASQADEQIVSRVESVAHARGVSMATVSLSWCLAKKAYPITGLGNKGRIDEAVESLKFRFTGEEIRYLEEPYLPRNVMY